MVWLSAVMLLHNGDWNPGPWHTEVEFQHKWQRLEGGRWCVLCIHVEHALSCPTGGFIILRHNELRDITARLMTEVWHGHPSLWNQPFKHCQENMALSSAITTDDASHWRILRPPICTYSPQQTLHYSSSSLAQSKSHQPASPLGLLSQRPVAGFGTLTAALSCYASWGRSP